MEFEKGNFDLASYLVGIATGIILVTLFITSIT